MAVKHNSAGNCPSLVSRSGKWGYFRVILCLSLKYLHYMLAIV